MWACYCLYQRASSVLRAGFLVFMFVCCTAILKSLLALIPFFFTLNCASLYTKNCNRTHTCVTVVVRDFQLKNVISAWFLLHYNLRVRRSATTLKAPFSRFPILLPKQLCLAWVWTAGGAWQLISVSGVAWWDICGFGLMHPTDVSSDWDLRNSGLSQCFWLFVVFHKLFLSNLCSVAKCIVLLGEEAAVEECRCCGRVCYGRVCFVGFVSK